RAAAFDAAAAAEDGRRRSGADGRDRAAGDTLWPLRLSPHPRDARCRGLAGERQAGLPHLAPGRAQSADKTAEAGPSLAQRWIVRPSETWAAEPRLVL